MIKLLSSLAYAVFSSFIGWIIIAPISLIVPRRREWLTVIGRDDGKFLDNAKYFFTQAQPLLSPQMRTVYITERRDVVELLSGTDYEVMLYPSLDSVMFLLRSGTTIVDSAEWVQHLRRFLTMGSKVVQLWHGVGFKRIELDKWSNEAGTSLIFASRSATMLRKAMHRFTGRLVRYHAVNTTSRFYKDEVFLHAFLSRNFIISGYPRNTFGKVNAVANPVNWKNVDGYISKQLPRWLEGGRKIILVAPTFRDSRAVPIGLSSDVIAMLDRFCECSEAEIVFKFHPLEKRCNEIRGRHLHVCDPTSDLYPVMPASSTLITDYSSIYMDYLLLDKPVMFLVPDLNEYINLDRQLQFDFHDMTPGPKANSWEELLPMLLEQWRRDSFREARSRLRRLAFDDLPQEESVPKLIAFMQDRQWIPDDAVDKDILSSLNKPLTRHYER